MSTTPIPPTTPSTPGAPPPSGSSQGPWIIAGAIVLGALVVVIALVMMNRDSGTPESSPSPSVTESPSPSVEPSPSPTKTRSPRPPTPSPTPTTSPSPSVDNSTLVREATEKAAEADRPGEVKHIGSVAFMKNTACATREGASASVRYTMPEKQGTFFLCLNTNGRWKVTQGPIYGE